MIGSGVSVRESGGVSPDSSDNTLHGPFPGDIVFVNLSQSNKGFRTFFFANSEMVNAESLGKKGVNR